MVVVATEQGEVVYVGAPARLPRHDVVDVGEGDVGAAREATVPVAPAHLAAQGRARKAPGPALVHGVPDVVVDGNGDGGVTGDAPDGLGVDQPMMLEFAGELGGIPRVID